MWYHINMKRKPESGEVNSLMVVTVVLGIVAAALGIAFGWAFMQMNDYKNNADQKAEVAATEAREAQRAESDEQCAEEYKKPFLVYRSPSDFGSVEFSYPRNWSSYIEQAGVGPNGGDQLAVFFYPVSVPTINDNTVYALRLRVINQAYEEVLKSFEGQVQEGRLRASPIVLASGFEGIRIDGQLSDVINGSVVVFKIRDKTLIIRTDSQTFMNDFNNIILPSLKFEP